MIENFDSLNLDERILRALKKIGLERMLPIQEKVIPIALEGKDVLVSAKTGAGKTIAYCIPILDKLLKCEENGNKVIYI